MGLKKSIPSVLTALNLVAGFVAIILNDPYYSPLIIFTGAFLDLFDGAIARKIGVSSDFGAELDSLADLVTFGVAPAFLYYHHILHGYDILSMITTAILVLCSALRLAKFNVDTGQKYGFKGLPTPSTGLFFAFLVYEVYAKTTFDFEQNKILWQLLPLVFAFLMISNIPFFSMKKSQNNKNKIIQTIIIFVFAISFILWIMTKMPFIPLAVIIYIFISLICLFCSGNK